jgi:short-subunit dehydrogenase
MPARTISGKVVIITGASSGIGRALAMALAREGAKLALVARRESLLQELERDTKLAGGTTVSMPLDLREKGDVETMIRSTRDRYGRIDVLINNAGFGFYGAVEDTPDDVVREIFDLNFEAPLRASRLVVPIMRAQGGGHIINISSIAGRRGLPLSGIYSATKFALNGISESLRVEVKDAGIDVTIVNPAATRTDFGDNVRRVDVAAKFKSLGHVQSAEEVAAAVVRCMKRPKPEVFPYGVSRVLVWANAFSPALVDRIMTRIYRRRVEEGAIART